MRLRTPSLTTNQTISKRLIVGFAALSTAAVVGAVNLAGAAPMNKPTDEQCQAAGFQNHGQCVKEWAHHKPHPGNGNGNPGSGYGGNQVDTNVNIDVSGQNNIVKTVINIFVH